MDCFARKDPYLELKRDLENINALAFSGQKVMNIKVYMGDDALSVRHQDNNNYFNLFYHFDNCCRDLES